MIFYFMRKIKYRYNSTVSVDIDDVEMGKSFCKVHFWEQQVETW